MNKMKTVTVAIAAYNAEQNIKRLLLSLTGQIEKNYVLKKIVVYSDKSTDGTVKYASEIKSKKVLITNAQQRRGFASVVVYLLKNNESDILVLLNDDVVINDILFIHKIVRPFYRDKNIGLACASPIPFRSGNFIERAVRSGFFAYKNMSYHVRNGNNIFTCDGKALILSRQFIQALLFPKNYKEMGNVDGYLYFCCLQYGFKYRHIKDAILYFKCPSSIYDFVRWQTRNNANKYILKKRFGEVVDKEYKIPKIIFAYYRFIEAIKNPFGSVLIYMLGLFSMKRARVFSQNFAPKWDLVETTKNLHVIK